MSELQDKVWLENAAGQEFPIVGTCSIGRSSKNQITLVDDRVSRRHALVHAQEQNEYWLVDLGSSNGTLLNGRRISQPTKLNHGDQLQIGGAVLTLQQPATLADTKQLADDGNTNTFTRDRTLVEIKTAPCWLLVADITGSTQLHKRFAPEELPVVTGQWLAQCKQLIEDCGGSINKFLGDGFFAYWHSREGIPQQVALAAQALKRLQDGAKLPFRFVVHHGAVFLGGASMGEENLSGREVNFIFRMEKVAAQLAETRLVSETAATLLTPNLACKDIGQHPVPSFEGKFGFRNF
jgi:adenylate cyclase